MQKSLMDNKRALSPGQFAEYLSEMGDIYFWPQGNFWVITDYELAKETLKSPAVTCDRKPFFISRMPNMDLSLLPDFFNVVSRMMVMVDDTLHKQSRRVCYHGFSNHHINALKPAIIQTIEQSIEQIHPNEPFDFNALFAELIPKKTLADFFAIPEADRDEFSRHAKTMTSFFGGESDYQNEDGIRVNHAAKALSDYFRQLVKERRQTLQDDFLSELIRHQNHFKLDDEDIIAQAIMMWVAGMVTTSDQMNNNCFTLLQSGMAHFHQAIKEDKLDPLVEELNRLDPAVTFTFRMTRLPMQIGGQSIPVGSTLFISNHAVNRDKRAWNSSHHIDMTHNKPHMSYGFGSHFCLGAKLSLLEMRLCFEYLFKKFPRLKIVDYQRHHYSLSFSGFDYLKLLAY